MIRRPGQINAMNNEDFAEAVRKTGKKQIVIRYVDKMPFPSILAWWMQS